MVIETYHEEHPADRAVMTAMRGMIALQPAANLGPHGRAAFDELVSGTPRAEGVVYEAAEVGGVPGWWCRSPGAAAGAILYFHGGAYVLGSAKAYRNFVGHIAARVKVDAFIPDYGLAPERPFPAAADDGEAVYRGLASAGISRIAVVGDSAGGGLALVTLIATTAAARQGSVPRPVAAVLMSPWTDLALAGESIKSRADHDPLLTGAMLEGARHLYLGESEPTDPRASPLHGDLTDLPPVLLHVGEDEILLDDSRRLALALTQSGSTSALHVWRGMVHVFPANLAVLHAARDALDIVGTFLSEHLGVVPTKTT